MNSKLLLISVFVGTLIMGGIFIVSKNPNIRGSEKAIVEPPEQEALEKKEGEGMTEKDGSQMQSNSSRYVEYSKSVLDQFATKRRVLYFYATWCPTCKISNEDFLANSDKIPEDIVVVRINYSDPDTDREEKDLAEKYGIVYQHTFVQIDAGSNEVAKWNGGGVIELIGNVK